MIVPICHSLKYKSFITIHNEKEWLYNLCKHGGGGKGREGGLRSCHTRKGVETVRFRFQKRYVAQKVSKKPIQPMGLRDKHVPFLAAPPEQV